MEFDFTFGAAKSKIVITEELPSLSISCPALVVCDTNTEFLAKKIFYPQAKLCVIESGEANKSWSSVEIILKSAHAAGLDRSSLLIGVGGGVVSDLCAFAASVYMRGIKVKLVSTTLLGMVDASVGGKTGFDFLGIKNLAGTFYPAETVYMPLCSLDSLPPKEWKSGMAELIKTAILESSDFLNQVKTLKDSKKNLEDCINRAVMYKGSVVESDPNETKENRALLNLGHSFGHALETSFGLGEISHGEAVAWGMARACELGAALGITPAERAAEIKNILYCFNYETKTPYPGMETEKFMQALASDKKNKTANGLAKMNFIVPDQGGARQVSGENELIRKIINGVYQ